MRYLITGSAGFIGYHLSLKLLKKGFLVFGIDSLNNYYSNKLKLFFAENSNKAGRRSKPVIRCSMGVPKN